VFRIVKLADEEAVPFDVPTRILPVVVPLATVAVIWVELSTEKLAAALPPNDTPVAPFRLVPVMTTTVPAMPEVGAKLEIVGVVGGGLLFEAALPQPAVTASMAQSSMTPSNRSGRARKNFCKLLKTDGNME